MTDRDSVHSAEAQLASFFAKYEPALARLGKALRGKLRARLPGLSEVVYYYANQDALVISYSPTENGYDAVCSLAIYPSEVKLFFAKGPQLSKADPHKLLQGGGKVVRYVALDDEAAFDRAEIEALMAAALQVANVRPDPRATGAVILKAEEQKRRARTAKKAANKAPKKAPKKSPKSAASKAASKAPKQAAKKATKKAARSAAARRPAKARR